MLGPDIHEARQGGVLGGRVSWCVCRSDVNAKCLFEFLSSLWFWRKGLLLTLAFTESARLGNHIPLCLDVFARVLKDQTQFLMPI